MKHLKKKKPIKETKICICNIISTMRTTLLLVAGIFASIGICSLDNYYWKVPIINFFIAFVCMALSVILDNLLFETAYKQNDNTLF